MAIAGPDGVDAAIKAGVDLDGSPIPEAMLALYNQVMDLESPVSYTHLTLPTKA